MPTDVTAKKIVLKSVKKSEEKLNFEVFNLEELRRRKRERELTAVAGTSDCPSETTTMTTTATPSTGPADESSQEPQKRLSPRKRKIDECNFKSKPVKLRRWRDRAASATASAVGTETAENLADRNVEAGSSTDVAAIERVAQPRPIEDEAPVERVAQPPPIDGEKPLDRTTKVAECDSSFSTEMPNDTSYGLVDSTEDLFVEHEEQKTTDFLACNVSQDIIEEIDFLLQE